MGHTPQLAAMLERATRAGEGRVRQVIATAARLDSAAGVIKDALLAWLDAEADEFTKGAIRSALDSTNPAPAAARRSFQMPEQFVDAYRYTAERLCHRIRNPLTRSASLLMRLQQLSQQTSDAVARDEMTMIYGELQGLFQRVGRVVEFDVNDTHVQWRSVPLGIWLENAGPVFAGRHGQATFLVQGSAEARRAPIRATGFLLDTVFVNMWVNAVQASEQDTCRITAEMALRDGSLELLFRDDGPGFSADQVDAAFRLMFSTKGEARGRGLLEIAEAVGRLQGTVRLVEIASGEHRIHFRFPVDAS
jgi:signal transduction histidine kinase